MLRRIVAGVVALLVLITTGIGPGRAARVAAQASGPAPEAGAPATIKLAKGTAAVEAAVGDAVLAALEAGRDRLPAMPYAAVTAVRAAEGWQLVSVAGLRAVAPDGSWRLIEDGAWFGLVIVHRLDDGRYSAAVETGDGYAALLDAAPASLLGAAARQDLQPAPVRAAVAALRFPWPAGSKMLYGSLGVHDSGFPAWVSGWKAVDFLSDGNTAAGHAANRLQASAPGTIGAVCDDGTSLAIRMDSAGSPQLLYVHLQSNARLHTGSTFAQGDEIGQMRPGSFNAACGWANQGAGWFHVHYAFPAGAGALVVENWTLNLDPADQNWYSATQVRRSGDWLAAGAATLPALPAPVLSAPAANSTLPANASLVFSWEPVADAAAYQIAWSGGPYTNTLPLGWFAGTSYDVGTVAPGEYTWRVRARGDVDTAGLWSETRHLTVVPAPAAQSPRSLQAFLPLLLAIVAAPAADLPGFSLDN